MSKDIRPDYYKAGGVECIDAIEAISSDEEFRGFLKSNVLKYIWRYRDKCGASDLIKARYYLDKLINLELDTERRAEKPPDPHFNTAWGERFRSEE